VRGVALAAAGAVALVLAGAQAALASWAQTTPLIPSGTRFSNFNQVTCPARNHCVAVGNSTVGNSFDPLTEEWNGTSWTLQTTPAPPQGTFVELVSVSCLSARDCFAVGQYNFGAVVKTLVEHWNGVKWTVQPTPNPDPSTEAYLLQVSCASATSCLAVGNYANGATGGQIAEAWNGTSWTLLNVSFPPGQINGLSCLSATDCVAVGNNGTGVMAETWNGSAWTAQSPPPLPGGTSRGALRGLWCGSATDCVAVGQYSVAHPLAESWNGTQWAPMPAARIVGLKAGALTGVSCSPTGTTCTAVGSLALTSAPKSYQTFAEHWTGTRWRQQPTVAPAGARASSLTSVACRPSGGNCTAVGQYTSARKVTRLLAEQDT
jgi:hypothetical protein